MKSYSTTLLLACTIVAAGCTASPTAHRDSSVEPRFGHTFGSGNAVGDATPTGSGTTGTTATSTGETTVETDTTKRGHTFGSGN
jgi:hypothetical protein